MKKVSIVLALVLGPAAVGADGSTIDAAIGGGLGGAAGAAIGNELGGRDGAIVGGALGGAVGTALNTESEPRQRPSHTDYYRSSPPPAHNDRFCPPGQAKKGRC